MIQRKHPEGVSCRRNLWNRSRNARSLSTVHSTLKAGILTSQVQMVSYPQIIFRDGCTVHVAQIIPAICASTRAECTEWRVYQASLILPGNILSHQTAGLWCPVVMFHTRGSSHVSSNQTCARKSLRLLRQRYEPKHTRIRHV